MSTPTSKRNLSPGWILVVLGLILFVMEFIQGAREEVLMILIGGAFLFSYFANRNFGYLVPGCVLLGLAIGGLDANNAVMNSTLGLGLGFVAIFLIELIYQGNRTWWPLIPGIALIITGATDDSEGMGRVIVIGWPLIFVLAGLWMLRRARARDRSDNPDAGPEGS